MSRSIQMKQCGAIEVPQIKNHNLQTQGDIPRDPTNYSIIISVFSHENKKQKRRFTLKLGLITQPQ